MKKTYKVLALDIDGTLTMSNKEMSKKTVQSVIDLQERGIRVAIASGRSEYGFRHIADELQLAKYNNYIMSFNGGKIQNYKTGEVVYHNPLPLAYLEEIFQVAKKYNLGILGYKDEYLISGNGIDEYQEYDAWACQMQLKEVENFPHFFHEPFNKCLLTGRPEKLREVVESIQMQFEGRLNVFLSEEFFIEVLPFGIHKAAALSQLLERLHCTQDELVCVGDGLNDLTMIEYAGLGVAMANANPVVLDKADYITESNDRDGIVKVINEFFD